MNNCDTYLLHLSAEEQTRQYNNMDFDRIYKKYSKYIFRYSCRFLSGKEDAENIVHDTFIAFMNAGDRFDAEKDPLPYLYTIARNRCISMLRRRAVESRQDYISLVAAEYEPPLNISGIDIRNMLRKALGHMSPKVRETFVMSRYQGMTNKEIAQSLGISERGVEERMKKAMLELRKHFKDYL